MDITQLQTFIRVSKYGSFTKAAEESFISSTAVMKQINRLETELNLTLFVRSATGVRLTEQGATFLPAVQQILAQLTTAIVDARHVGLPIKDVITVGTSLLHPAEPFMRIWQELSPKLAGFQLRVIQLQNDDNSSNREYALLGRTCDLMVGTFDNTTLKQAFTAFPLGHYHFEIAVRHDHPLAHHKRVTLDDLAGQRLLMVPTGISEKNDALRAQIQTAYPTIQPCDTTGCYDLNDFNRAVADNLPLVTLTPWHTVHPELVSIPLVTDLTVPYGILTSKFPGTATTAFMTQFAKDYAAISAQS